MALSQTVAPAVEPLTLADAKTFLRLEHAVEDAFITSLITTSRLHVEAALDLALITQKWTQSVKRTDRRIIPLRLHPVQSVDAVRIVDSVGASTAIDLDDILIDRTARPERVCLPAMMVVTAFDTVDIDMTVGFGDAPTDVPDAIRHALLLLIAHWYEVREPVAMGAGGSSKVPTTVSDLLSPYRPVKL